MTEPFLSYAQNFEDVVLARALQPDAHRGTWIDVGAGDPVADSVTAVFAERGWCGINVEPLAAEYERLCAARPSDVNLNIALGAREGTATLYAGPPENRGSSTLSPDLAAHYRREGQEFTPHEVPVSTLANVVASHVTAPVDFLKIDVEGAEADVLAGADWTAFRPRIVVVESTLPGTTHPTYQAWDPMLLGAEYCFALFDGLNRFYVRAEEPELLEALRAPANVLDNFAPYRYVHERDEALDWAQALERRLSASEGHAQTLESELAACLREVDQISRDVSRMSDEAARCSRLARRNGAMAMIAEENYERTLEELRAAHVRTARAMQSARDVTESARRERDALLATRTFVYTARARAVYARVRHLIALVG
jgi:FkbM family methyltransferase